MRSDLLAPGTHYAGEICIDGQCEHAELYANDSRDRSSGATSPTTDRPSAGVIGFDLALFDVRQEGSVTVRIFDSATGEIIVDYRGSVDFNPHEINGPDCDDPPCWGARLFL